MTARRFAMRRLSGALAVAGIAALFAAGCVVREREGYYGSPGSDRGSERRDDDRSRGDDRRDDRRDDDRRNDERGGRY
jgi:hypothetical protein